MNTPLTLAGFGSVPEYIYGITREIWEDRGLGPSLVKYYASDVVVRSPAGILVGNGSVLGQTLQTLHEFPDRQLVGEDVIWTPGPGGSFLSSHRLISVMRHQGDGALGPASNRLVHSRVIADCWVHDGQVKEEWLVRDQSAWARCLGATAEALGRQAAENDLKTGRRVEFFRLEEDRPSRYAAQIADDPGVESYLDGMRRIWDAKETAAIRDQYFAGALLHVPGGTTRHGFAEIDRFVIGYLASFPDAELTIYSAIVNCEPEQPTRIAVRWGLRGTHSGYGTFGAPSGAPVFIMGLTHSYLTAGRVHFEWLLTDEVSIWKQIYAHRLGKATV